MLERYLSTLTVVKGVRSLFEAAPGRETIRPALLNVVMNGMVGPGGSGALEGRKRESKAEAVCRQGWSGLG